MKKHLPSKRDVRLILAEDVRQEMGGKLSLMGVMPGERFLVGGKPPPGLENVTFSLPSLAFVFVIGGGEGKAEGRFKVVAPDKRTTIVDVPMEKPIEMSGDKPTVFATASKPFMGPAFGRYTVVLEIGGTKFSFPMIIEKRPEKLPGTN